MLTRSRIVLIAVLLSTSAVRSDGISMSVTPQGGGGIGGFDGGISAASVGGSPPPSCSNKLDFTQACNSQYIPVI